MVLVQAERLAAIFEANNNELIAFVESCTEALWTAPCQNEGRPVNVIAHHVAGGYRAQLRWVESLASAGEIPTVTGDLVNGWNAQHAEKYATVDRETVTNLLRSNGSKITERIRSLTQAELARRGTLSFFNDQPMTTEQAIETIFIAHQRGHLANLLATKRALLASK